MTDQPSPTLQSRVRGALLGLAAGDALGTTVEFKRPGSFKPLTDIVGGGPFQLKAGQWTDDTSMALCLAESLLEKQGFDPVDQLERYVRWMYQGHLSSNGLCFDVGGTVRAALKRFQETKEPYCGSEDPMSAGNGSIMRLAPVAIAYAHRPAEAIERAAQSSRTTHAASEAQDACRYMAGLLCGALAGAAKDELLTPDYCPVPGLWAKVPLAPKVAKIAAGSFREKRPPEIRGTGYVIDSLEAALWALRDSSSFEEGALLAVNLGDDADTTGAVYGQLAGALYGEEGIPNKWREKLAKRELLVDFADRLFALSRELKPGSTP